MTNGFRERGGLDDGRASGLVLKDRLGALDIRERDRMAPSPRHRVESKVGNWLHNAPRNGVLVARTRIRPSHDRSVAYNAVFVKNTVTRDSMTNYGSCQDIDFASN
jgi:hypothetical protein